MQSIIRHDRIASGLACVLRAVEPCQSFVVVRGENRPRLQPARRRCLCYYFYYLHDQLGLMHVRIQSWLPLTIHVCVNGHEWLARQMTHRGLPFLQRDNAFVAWPDSPEIQSLADQFAELPWVELLDDFARQVNPLLADEFHGFAYQWVADQAEYSTDVLFRDAAELKLLCESWLQHALTAFGAEDVLTFLGRKLHGNFQGEVLTEFKRRDESFRIKHRLAGNWLKMYLKAPRLLRVETVINRPGEFKVFLRPGVRKGVTVHQHHVAQRR